MGRIGGSFVDVGVGEGVENEGMGWLDVMSFKILDIGFVF